MPVVGGMAWHMFPQKTPFFVDFLGMFTYLHQFFGDQPGKVHMNRYELMTAKKLKSNLENRQTRSVRKATHKDRALARALATRAEHTNSELI